MTETPDRVDEPETGSVATLPPPPPPPAYAVPEPRHHRPNRLFQVAAWVAIVAGTLFIVATIFFTGFILGRHSGGGHGNWPQHGNGQFHHRQWQQMMPFPGQMGPGQMGPGMMGPYGPGGPGAGAPGAGGPGAGGSPTTLPSPPRP